MPGGRDVRHEHMDTLVSNQVAVLKYSFPEFPGIAETLAEHLYLCQAQGYYSPLTLTSKQIEKMTNYEFRPNPASQESHFSNLRFEKQGGDAYRVFHPSLESLRFNPMLNGFGTEIKRMLAETGLELSDDLVLRFHEISERFSDRYGNGFASMTRMMAVLTNAGRS
jgi:hypothetical protein